MPLVAWRTHRVLLPLLQAWKAHLMGSAGCTANLRKTRVLHKAPALPPGKGRACRHLGTHVVGSPPLCCHLVSVSCLGRLVRRPTV